VGLAVSGQNDPACMMKGLFLSWSACFCLKYKLLLFSRLLRFYMTAEAKFKVYFYEIVHDRCSGTKPSDWPAKQTSLVFAR